MTSDHKNAERSARRSAHIQAWAGIVVALVLVALPLWKVADRHMASPNFWFDEAGQYWLALGLHHFSGPNEEPGGWGKIVEYGRVFNSDPGAFTLMLRGWIVTLGSSPAALRSLPFFFLVAMCAIIALATRRTGASWPLAALAATAPLGFVMLLHYGTELRAYSMEACAVALLFFAPAWWGGRFDLRRTLTLGLVAAVLVSSRYSAYFFGAAACLTALPPLRPPSEAVRRALAFGIPVTLAVILGYAIFARLQAGGSHEPPAYVEALLLKGKDSTAALALLKRNFLSRDALPLTVFLLAAPLFVLFGPRGLADFRAFVSRAWLFSLLSTIFVAGVSLAGKLPWAIHTRWSIGYQALAACCLALGFVVLVRWIAHLAPARLSPLVHAMLLAAGAWFAIQESTRAVGAPRAYYETIADHLASLSAEREPRSLRFFVPSNASPAVRYLCERGPYRGLFSYPGQFHFETPEEVAEHTPISASKYDAIILTHVSLAESYRARVTGGTASLQTAPQPSCLILLAP